MAKEKSTIENPTSSKRIESIDTDQLEYTAEKMFTYGTITIAVVAVYASIIYMGVQQLKK